MHPMYHDDDKPEGSTGTYSYLLAFKFFNILIYLYTKHIIKMNGYTV